MKISTEQRLLNLEHTIKSLSNKIDNLMRYNNFDKDSIKNIEGEHSDSIEVNTKDISDNRQGLEETFETSLTNADDIADVRTALEEVYEIITESEV